MDPFPPLEPFDHGLLDVGDYNLVYWETCGNPAGKPALVVHRIYNGYWFWGRPSFVDLWHDLRDVFTEVRPDWDLGTPGLLLSCPRDEGTFLGGVKPLTLPPGRAQFLIS